ncbi:MAG: thiamine pyrophosphate-binding protein, partial [Bacteroidetes bacterium]
LMTQAIKHAIINREVSHITFPDEVQVIAKPEHEEAQTPEGRITPFTISPPEEMLENAIKLISKSKRPVIIVGHGARYSMPGIIRMAEMMNSPVITTFKGKGLIADEHPLGCGVLGRSGTPIASWFMNESDLLIVLGASFSNHTGITPKKPIIQVDFDPMALSKFHKIDVALWGEVGLTCTLLQKALSGKTASVDQRQEVASRWKIWKEEKNNRLKDDHGKGISSIAVFNAMNRITPDNAVIAVDVGNNTYSFGRYFECKNQSILMSGYLGSIGFALPAAMGAWAAVKNTRPVWSLSGDGGLGQYLAELTTLVKYNMPIKHILINNSELGKISKEQRGSELEVWKTSLHNPNFADFANNCGALGIRVEKKEELEAAMQKISDHNGPALLDIVCDVALI